MRDKNEYRRYVIASDSVYYLGEVEVGEDTDKIVEYKLIVNNGEVTETENATYNAVVSGAVR